MITMNRDESEMETQFVEVDDIEKFFWMQLVKLGYTPSNDEIKDLADICFDYLCSIGVVEEIDIDD